MNVTTRTSIARAWLRLAAVTVVAGCALAAAAQPAAAAAAPALKWDSSCSNYMHFAEWKTSTQWGRVSHRSCVEWTTNSNLVRAREDLRVDWPDVFHCNITFPSGSSCSISQWKAPMVEFHYVRQVLKWNMAGSTGGGECRMWVNHVSNHDNVGPGTTDVASCHSPNYTMARGTTATYAVNAGIKADIKGDGDGIRTLPATGDWSETLTVS
jgi:hypothetical protein